MKVAEAMSVDVVSVPPETPLKDAAALLERHGISGLPVLEGGTVVGVVSEADIVARSTGRRESKGILGVLFGARNEEDVAHTHVREAMSSSAITIAPGRQVAEAARVTVERRVNRLPVVDDLRLVGIVTRADLVRAFVRSDEELDARSARASPKLHSGSTVRDSMWLSTGVS
jgi:CBS domain-containing protein